MCSKIHLNLLASTSVGLLCPVVLFTKYQPTEHQIYLTDHCIDMLRQKITCDGDVGIITQDWVAQRTKPWPNFNTWHKCRNFDGIIEWNMRMNAPNYGETLTRPDDIEGLDPPP